MFTFQKCILNLRNLKIIQKSKVYILLKQAIFGLIEKWSPIYLYFFYK